MSIIQTYQPPVMEVTEDTIPELQPIFSLLNYHSNKLYHEGYFLKLDDQNTRTWRRSNPYPPPTFVAAWALADLDTHSFRGQTEPR
jgi:CCR4-NOT transcriptional complex subunit CAF120